MQPKPTIRLRLIAIIFVAVVAIISAVTFFVHYATHGRLSVTADYPIEQVFLYRRSSELLYEFADVDPYGDIPAGDYLINVNFSDNRLHTEEITIGGFYSLTTVTVPGLPAIAYTKVLDATWGKYLPLTADSYLSFYPFYGTQVLSSSGEVLGGFTPLSVHDAYYNQNNALLSTSVFSGKTGENDQVAFFRYDESAELNYHIATKSLPKQTTISHGQDGFYYIQDGTLYSFTPDGESATTIPSNVRYAMFAATPIMNKNATHMAFLEGNDYETPPAEEAEPLVPFDELVDNYINIYPTRSLDDDSKKISIPVTKSSNIRSLSISPDSQNIAVLYDNFTEFYSIQTKQLILSTKASIQTNDIVWTTDSSAVFLNSSMPSSIQLADLDATTVSTLLMPNQITISQFCGHRDNILYFTAFEQGNAGQSQPGGYHIDLSEIK